MTETTEYPTFDEGPAALREAYGRAVKENKDLRDILDTTQGEIRGVRIADAGFPEGSHGYKNLMRSYEGDFNDKEAVQTYAMAEFGYEPDQAEQTSTAVADPTKVGDAKVEAVAAATKPVIPATKIEEAEAQLQELEKAGDWKEALKLKNRIYDVKTADR